MLYREVDVAAVSTRFAVALVVSVKLGENEGRMVIEALALDRKMMKPDEAQRPGPPLHIVPPSVCLHPLT